MQVKVNAGGFCTVCQPCQHTRPNRHSDLSPEHNFIQSFFKASWNSFGPAFVVEVADTPGLQAARLVAVQPPPPHGQTEAVVPVVWTCIELPGGGGR